MIEKIRVLLQCSKCSQDNKDYSIAVTGRLEGHCQSQQGVSTLENKRKWEGNSRKRASSTQTELSLPGDRKENGSGIPRVS